MSSNPNDIGYFYSGGLANGNPFLSTGGAKSSIRIKKNELENLWTSISERQARYGYKDHRCFYVQNLSTSLTIKNARAYFLESDKFSTLQIGSAPVNTPEQVAPGNPQPTAVEIPPSQWATIAATPIRWTIIQDYNSLAIPETGTLMAMTLGNAVVRQRAATKIDDASASFVNQAPGRVSFVLRRDGNPSGTVTCKIWDKNGNVKATIGSVNVDTLSTGSQNEQPVSFTNETQSYKIQVGDLVGIEYTNGDSNNYVVVGGWRWDQLPEHSSKDIPGTSAYMWDGSGNGTWRLLHGGDHDFKYKIEVAATGSCSPTPPDDPDLPGGPKPPPVDPGTKRKPTSYSDGIILPSLAPNDYKALWLERIIPPNTKHDVREIIAQSVVVEVDETTEPPDPGDPGDPGPDPDPNPPPGPGPGPGPGGIGPYISTGKELQATTRRATRHYASGKPDDETVEKNTKSIPYQHYQCIYYVTMHGVEHDDTVSVKYGGTHMGTGWFDHGITFNTGKTCMGKEENHPSTDLCVIEGPSYGSILNKRIGIAGVYRKPTNFCELWIKLPGAAWVKAIEAANVGGFNPGASQDEAQLRIDGFEDGDDPTIDTALVQEIAG